MGQSLNIITAPLPMCMLTVCVCDEFVWEKCVYIQLHGSVENYVCVFQCEEHISIGVCVCVCVSHSSCISTWGIKLNSPEYKDRRGKG